MFLDPLAEACLFAVRSSGSVWVLGGPTSPGRGLISGPGSELGGKAKASLRPESSPWVGWLEDRAAWLFSPCLGAASGVWRDC
jgi:hypothetical protein